MHQTQGRNIYQAWSHVVRHDLSKGRLYRLQMVLSDISEKDAQISLHPGLKWVATYRQALAHTQYSMGGIASGLVGDQLLSLKYFECFAWHDLNRMQIIFVHLVSWSTVARVKSAIIYKSKKMRKRIERFSSTKNRCKFMHLIYIDA